MPKIVQLSSHVADLIAAGEVVERPASVVKELVENAIDAGATRVTIEIQNGGMTFIRISDNGCGMSPEDARTAFLRHATSKIRNKDDLAAISTLGFRGEALAAISAVSRIDLLTKAEDTPGVSLHLDAGQITQEAPAGAGRASYGSRADGAHRRRRLHGPYPHLSENRYVPRCPRQNPGMGYRRENDAAGSSCCHLRR